MVESCLNVIHDELDFIYKKTYRRAEVLEVEAEGYEILTFFYYRFKYSGNAIPEFRLETGFRFREGHKQNTDNYTVASQGCQNARLKIGGIMC